jgi:hypothetical protein
MKLHANARLSLKGRELLIARVEVGGEHGQTTVPAPEDDAGSASG